MQQRNLLAREYFQNFTQINVILLCLCSLFVVSCSSPPAALPPVKPHVTASIVVSCTDPEWARELQNRGAIWASRTGGTVKIVTTLMDSADILVGSVGDLTVRANLGTLDPVPTHYRLQDHPTRWDRILDSYRVKLASWGQTVYGLPLRGECDLLLYRADLFSDPLLAQTYRGQFGQVLAPPHTYEEMLMMARFFQEQRKKPALPPFPTDRQELVHQFHQIVACYDRRPVQLTELTKVGAEELANASLRFHYDVKQPTPRIQGNAFVKALEWLVASQAVRPNVPQDPLEAVAHGSAVMAIVPLESLARLPRGKNGAVDERFAVAPLPGTSMYFDEKGLPQPAAAGRNYLPFVGDKVLYGMVTTASQQKEAAWDFLSEVCNPAGTQTTLTQPKLGSGPLRIEDTSETSTAWEVYGFDDQHTKDLTRAIREYLPFNAVNPVFTLRWPDRAERYDVLAQEIQIALAGKKTAAQALESVASAWTSRDQTLKNQASLWRRRALGID
jgi:ABC-type glycerol-3-phosphate transport system substrate-binding protein